MKPVFIFSFFKCRECLVVVEEIEHLYFSSIYKSRRAGANLFSDLTDCSRDYQLSAVNNFHSCILSLGLPVHPRPEHHPSGKSLC